MIHIVRQNTELPKRWRLYQMANRAIAYCAPVKRLDEFRIDDELQELHDLNVEVEKSQGSKINVEILGLHNSDCVYEEKITFHNKLRTITAWRSNGLTQIDIDNEPGCNIDFEKKRITLLNNKPVDSLFNIELITGPALILLLAQQSIFSLHASAVRITDSQGLPTNVAFIAESGVGKSTLSASVDRCWVQYSDDILPVSISQYACLYNDYPQLKLSNFKVSDKSILNNNLDYIFNISSDVEEGVVIEKLHAVDAVLTIIRHTVAARLFEPSMMKSHLEFATTLISKVTVCRISYPRDIKQLPMLRKEVIDFVRHNK